MRFKRKSITDSENSILLFRYQFFTRIFSCVGLFFLFITLLSPFWLTIIQANSHINVGLWNICKNHICQKLVGNSQILLLARILMSLSTISALIAVACVLFNKSNLKYSKWALITNLFTGIISLITMVLYGLSLKYEGFLGHPAPETSEPIYISWCFVMGCFASFLFLLNGLLFLLIEFDDFSTNQIYIQKRKISDDMT